MDINIETLTLNLIIDHHYMVIECQMKTCTYKIPSSKMGKPLKQKEKLHKTHKKMQKRKRIS